MGPTERQGFLMRNHTVKLDRGYTIDVGYLPEISGKPNPRPYWANYRSPQAKVRRWSLAGDYVNHADKAMIEQWVRDKIAAHKAESEKRSKARKARNAEKKAAAKANAGKFAVGTVLHYSWGYDQTNCEFYEVVEKIGETMVGIRRIAGKMEPGSEGFMSCSLKPCPGEFISDEVLRKKITAYGLRMDFGSATPVTEGRSYYSSWYA